MTTTRRALTIGIACWFSVQVILALLAIDQSRSVVVTVMAMLLGACLLGFVLRPRRWTRFTIPHEPVVAAVAVPVIQALSLVPLVPGAAAGYANWASNALGVVLAVLVIRDHSRLAVISGVAQVATELTTYAAQPGPEGVSLTAALLIAVPTQLWIGIAYGVRSEMRRNDRLVAMYLDRAAVDTATASLHRGESDALLGWQAEMADQLLPVLREVIESDDPADTLLRRQATLMSQSIRDSLKARVLTDPGVTAVVNLARALGVRVQLTSEVPPDSAEADMLTGVGDLVAGMLRLDGISALTVYVGQDPLEIISTAAIPSTQDAAVRDLLHHPHWTFTTTRVDQDLIIRGVLA